jgi:hypothetical protein
MQQRMKSGRSRMADCGQAAILPKSPCQRAEMMHPAKLYVAMQYAE